MKVFLARIEEANSKLNTIVSQLPASEALARAAAADKEIAAGVISPIHGLPIAIKDLNAVKGFRTTFGSRAHIDDPVSKTDLAFVERIRRAGAIIIGKTNTPERGVGTLAFNEVFGVTRNPWDLSKHGGGSSGAGAAVAAGLLPFADGSDSGGSIRYPSSFCNTVGLRTTPGLVPFEATGDRWSPHLVFGPMARSSEDAALLLSVMAGASVESPIAIDGAPDSFLTLDEVDLSQLRIAWSADAGGLPVSKEIRDAYARARETLEGLGCTIDDVEPDFSNADRAWEAVEMFCFFMDAPESINTHPDLFRPDYVRNVKQGAATVAADLAFGLKERTALYLETARLLERYDVFVTPATPVSAPPAEVEWVREIDGHVFDRYLFWQRLACRLTMTGHPVLVTPGGFTDTGMPFGLQITGPMRGDHRLLSIGNAIELATGWAARRPTAV
ncbi:MAG: amidase [Aliihoeflea sp.]